MRDLERFCGGELAVEPMVACPRRRREMAFHQNTLVITAVHHIPDEARLDGVLVTER
jgi:hypothetical protein